MQISLEVDDFSPLNHRFDLLNKLHDRYQEFKITLFTVPWEIRLSATTKGTPITEKQYKPWVDEVKQAIGDGWMEIAIHGLTHVPEEFMRLSYTEAQKRVLVAQKMFANVGIPVNSLFKAPYWLLSPDAEKGIKDLGLTIVKDGSYNWNIKDQIPELDIVTAHGHVQDVTGNGLDESFHRLLRIPQEAEWLWTRDLIKI